LRRCGQDRGIHGTVRREKTDLTYEGIETHGEHAGLADAIRLEKTDLTYEGIETQHYCP